MRLTVVTGLAYIAAGIAIGRLIAGAVALLRRPRHFIGADLKFDAFHHDGAGDEGWHEHDWTVTCWVRFPPWRDLRNLRAEMLRVLNEVAPENRDTGYREIFLDDWTNEAVGGAFLALPGVRWVSVDRDGFHARLQR